MLEIKLFGPLRIEDPDGIDRRPRLLKARAIFAVLAATPGHCRSRSWFHALLWGDRQHAQALSSLRSALADIRRHLGPYAGALRASNSEISLDANCVKVLEQDYAAQGLNGEFLEGLDVPNAEAFEDWLRQARAEREAVAPLPARAAAWSALPGATPAAGTRLYLAVPGGTADTMTRVQCDALVDGLAQTVEEFGLVEVVDGRHSGSRVESCRAAARDAQCSFLLMSETAEAAQGAIARLKVVETGSERIVWSKTLLGTPGIDLEDTATIGAVVQFVDVLSDRLARRINWHSKEMPADLCALAGVNHIFRLGAQNYEAADRLLCRAHAQQARGIHLAWRAYLRTFMLCELDGPAPEVLVEEGEGLARQAMEREPYNSMVLALCAHVENMLHDDYARAYDLSARALELNRCNPLAWASLGVAAAFLGRAQEGSRITLVGARLAQGTRYGFQTESWASAACILAGDTGGARRHAERSHALSKGFAPPLRYLTALYCVDGQFERALKAADKLKAQEDGFSLHRLRDQGYPVDSLRRARLLDAIPKREI